MLLVVIELKQLCRIANVEKINAGPKGLSLSFVTIILHVPSN